MHRASVPVIVCAASDLQAHAVERLAAVNILEGASKNHLTENFNPMKSASCNTEESETLDF